MVNYYLVEIDTIQGAKISSVFINNRTICPIVGIKHEENDYVDDYILGTKIYKRESNIPTGSLTYSNLIPLDTDMIKNYISIIRSLDEDNIKNYTEYFDIISNIAKIQKEEYDTYYNELSNLNNQIKKL